PDPGNPEFVQDNLGDPLDQGFDQLKAAVLHVSDQPLGDFLVVDGILDPVGGGCPPDIGAHFDIQADDLADLALPVVYTDNGIDLKVFDKNLVHHYGDLRLEAA